MKCNATQQSSVSLRKCRNEPRFFLLAFSRPVAMRNVPQINTCYMNTCYISDTPSRRRIDFVKPTLINFLQRTRINCLARH